MNPTRLVTLTLALATTACGSSHGSDRPDAGRPSDASVADSGLDAGADGGPDTGSPRLSVRILGTTAPFGHTDGLSGQTAIHASGGVRSLSLLRAMDDPAPVTLFDHGSAVVETGYDDGDDTVVATVALPEGLSGTFTVARLVQGYSRYEIDAAAHDGLTVEAGTMDNVLVMGDATMLDGTLRDAGYFEFSFTGPTVSFADAGNDWPIPLYSTTAGATAVVEDGQWAVYFPIVLDIPADPAPSSELVITVNMDDAFRWTDLLLLGYERGVFDITRISFEPVLRFGGNSFAAEWR